MAISINYRFLLSIAATVVAATALLCLLLMQLLGHHEQEVPLWGQRSIATDLITFSLIYGFILSWTVTKLTRKALRAKKVLPLHWHLKSQTLIDRLPTHSLHRAFMLGLAGLIMAGLMILIFKINEVEQLLYQEYLILYVVYAISLAAAITVMAFYRALGDRIVNPSFVNQKSTHRL